MQWLRFDRLLLCLALLSSLLTGWQLLLHAAENSFLDGICAAVAPPALPPEQRALRLFRWVSDDGPLPPAAAPLPARPLSRVNSAPEPPLPAREAPIAPKGLLTPRVMVEHRTYFQENCGAKAWLLATLARRAGLQAQELRLCDSNHNALHVVCEVWLDDAWRVLDPTARLDLRRSDGQLATAADLRDPLLLAANARRAARYDLRRWQYTHPERLRFEKVPLVGGSLRRLAPRLIGRPAEELAVPAALEQPRLLAAGGSGLLSLAALAAAGLVARRRMRGALREPEPARRRPALGLPRRG